MEVKAKQLDSVNAIASVKIPSGMIKNEVENLAKKASKNVKMNGFRPGKVPIVAVLKRYEEELTQDAQQNLFKAAVNMALKELKKEAKELIGEPYIEKLDRKEEGLSVELMLSFKPQFTLEGYEKLIPEYEAPKVSKKEIELKKEQLLKRFATSSPIKIKRVLQEGDFAKFDFEGFIDGKTFEGGKAQDYLLEIGSKRFIPGFEEGMLGMQIGEIKDIKLSFPKDYNAAHLAGKDVVFKVKLHEIQELKLPELDESLLKQLLPGEEKPSAELLDEKLKEGVYNEKLFKLINDELKIEFSNALVEKFDFALPRALVEQETDIQFRSAFNSFDQKELEELKNSQEKYQEKRNSFKEEAQKSVKLTFIVDELAKLRNIKIADQELIQEIYFEAYRLGINPKEHLQNYKEQGALTAVKMALLEEKVFNDIFKNQKLSKKEKEDK